MTAVRRVVIQGAGLGGLTLAAALGQHGVEVDVIEAAGPEAVLGVGLNVPNNALAALDEIGVKQAVVEAGFPFEDLRILRPDGGLAASVPPPVGRYGLPSNVAVSRPAYNRILRDAAGRAGARIRTGTTISRIAADGDGVKVETADDPATQRYDLLVGCDGVRSAVRQHLYGDGYSPAYTGTANWRVTLPRPAELTGISFASVPGARIVLTPISQEQMYIALVTPEPGNPHHERADYAHLVRERMAGVSGWLAGLRDSIGDEHPINYTPLLYLTVREPWFRGRIVIAGDAAHTSPPHLAQGGAMAVEDAVTLAAALDAHDAIELALAAWFERRRDRALFVADMSLALLKQEAGHAMSAEESALAAMGIPGAQVRLAQTPY